MMKTKFEFTTKGAWQKRRAEFIRYTEEIEEAKVNVTIKLKIAELS